MSTFQPPQFRDFGVPLTALWTPGFYVASPTPVTVHGGPFATYLSAGAGVESLDIDIDSLGVVPIPSVGTEASAADWVLTINTAYFAAFGVNPAFVDAFGLLALQGATRVVVSNYLDTGVGPGDAAFGVIGLPVIDRDGAAPQPFAQPDRTPTVQGVSLPIVVPRGANVVAVTPQVIGTDPTYDAALTWGLCLSDPTGPDALLNFLLIEGLAFADGSFSLTPAIGYVVRPYGADSYQSQFITSVFDAPFARFEFRLPFGGELRLWAAKSVEGTGAPLPQSNPTFAAKVRFSAR